MYDETYTAVVIDDNIRARYNDDSEILIDHAYLESLFLTKKAVLLFLSICTWWISSKRARKSLFFCIL